MYIKMYSKAVDILEFYWMKSAEGGVYWSMPISFLAANFG
jgi:hypothetical protein